MAIIKKLFFLLLCSASLTACAEKLTYSYLMQHPFVLQREARRCQELVSVTPDQAGKCKVILFAANNVMTLLSEQQADPEGFGQRILDAQMNYEKSAFELRKMEQSMQMYQTKNAKTELQSAQEQFEKLQKAQTERENNLKILLAIVGINTPS